MESKVIMQEENPKILISSDRVVSLMQKLNEDVNVIIIDLAKLSDLIAALQSFLPKETE